MTGWSATWEMSFRNHTFAVEAVGGVDDVHDLARAILALSVRRDREHARVELDEPAGHRVGRRADDDIDAGTLRGIKRTVHIGEVEYTRLRFSRCSMWIRRCG